MCSGGNRMLLTLLGNARTKHQHQMCLGTWCMRFLPGTGGQGSLDRAKEGRERGKRLLPFAVSVLLLMETLSAVNVTDPSLKPELRLLENRGWHRVAGASRWWVAQSSGGQSRAEAAWVEATEKEAACQRDSNAGFSTKQLKSPQLGQALEQPRSQYWPASMFGHLQPKMAS